MKTHKEVKDLLIQLNNEYNSNNTAAEKILQFFSPEYKPLNELVNSEEDCKKIFNFVTQGYGDNPITNIEYRDDCVLVESRVPYDLPGETFTRSVFILFDGSFDHFISVLYINDEREDLVTNDQPIENIFELVDFIRNLGYDVKN